MVRIDVDNVTGSTAVESGNQFVSISITDDDVSTPSIAVTPSAQQNTVSWSAIPGADNYTLYWKTSAGVSASDSSFVISSGSTTSYVHSGLNAGTTYYYKLMATDGVDSSALSAEANGQPTAFPGCSTSGTLTDNDTDLLVHYDFNNNLNDVKNAYGDGRYNLTNTGGTIKYAQSCAYGQAVYFDSTSGYLENTSFDDSSNSNLFTSGNFTIGLWFFADADMAEFSSMIASKQVSGVGNDGGNWSFQLDTDGSDKIRWRSSQGAEVNDPYITHTSTTSTYAKNQWYHATFVKQDNGTGQIYINGVLQATSTGTQHTPMERFRVGANRAAGKGWKGYIDEVKVYGRALTSTEVVDKCLAYSQCDNLTPNIPLNLTATAGVSQVTVAWDNVTGADNYTVYWTDTPSTAIDPANAATYDGTKTVSSLTTVITGLTNGTSYDFAVKATNSAGSSAVSDEANATPAASATVSLSKSGASLAENGGTVTLTATLSAAASANTSVTLSLSGNATINSDYTLSDNITINAGATTGTATLTGVNDSTDDDNETIVVDISAVSGGDGASENGTQQQTVNIIDDDVSTPSIAVTPSNEKNTISWSVIPGANRYVLYYSTSAGVSASDSPFYISGGSTTSYIHGGLTGGTTYYYRLKAVEGSNSSALSTEVSGQPTVGCSTTEQTDNDTDLLVHYDFNNNLNDVKNANGDGRYNLINTGGTIKYARGCGHGNAAYYDSTTGYAYNDNFTHNNIPTLTGNFTISLWINGDEDNKKFSAAYSSGSQSSSNHQIDVDDSDHLRMLFYNTGGADPGFNQNNITDANAITNGRWYYLTAVHTDANQWTLYRDAVVVGTQTAKATWDRLKIGINRNTDIRWKGYIDEFKIYGRSLTTEEVVDKCLAYAECDNVSPNIPTNLTATGGNLQVALSWDNMTGANNYTVYWSTDNSSFNTISPAVSGTTYTHTGRNPATIYHYKVAANNSAGTSDNSTVVSATTLSAPVVTLSGTASVNEGNSGTTNATVTASLSRTASADTTVTLTASGTATASADYTLSSSTITISAGNTTGTTTVGVLGDTTTEDNETVILDITGVSGGDSASESGVQNATVTIIDDDISLLGDFNIDNITQDFNRLSLGWDAPSNFDNSSDTYTFYWTTVAPSSRVPANRLVDASDNATPIILGTKSMYVHGTLDSTKTYYYRLGARDTSNGNILKLSTNEVSGSPLPVECTSTASSSTINDTDPDLLIYYPLNSDLLDKSAQGSRSSSDGWPFNISSNAGGSISFGEGCAYGNSAYFDGSGQLDGSRYNGSFGYNDNFSNSDIPDNWTISVWLNPDGDLEKFSSVISTGDDNDGPNLQIDVDDHYEPVGRIRAFNTISGDNKVHGPRLYIGNWYHAVLVHEADDDIFFYVNGRLRDSSTGWLKVCNSSSSPTCSPTRNQWDRIKIGLNRHGDNNWKGFIDEVKIFGRSLSATEIEALYQKTLPPIVEDLSLDNSTSGQIRLQWSAVPGSTSYTIYKVEQSLGGLTDVITFDQNNLNSSSTSLHTIPNVASGCVSGTCSHTDASLITNKWYYYRIAAVNGRGTGNVAPAAEVSARAN